MSILTDTKLTAGIRFATDSPEFMDTLAVPSGLQNRDVFRGLLR